MGICILSINPLIYIYINIRYIGCQISYLKSILRPFYYLFFIEIEMFTPLLDKDRRYSFAMFVYVSVCINIILTRTTGQE